MGLSTYESKAVSALLKKNHTVKELSKAAGIPPGKIYSVAKNLLEKGIIKTNSERPKVLYIDSASQLISRLTQEYEQKQDTIVSRLKRFASSIDKQAGKQTPFFDTGTTLADNKRIQARTFIEARKEVLQILNKYHKPRYNRKSKRVWEEEIRRAVHRGVEFKAIYPLRTILPPILKEVAEKHPSKFSYRRFNTDFVRCDIIDEKKVLLKLVDQDPALFGGVVFIEDKMFAKNLRRVFFKFWHEAEKPSTLN